MSDEILKELSLREFIAVKAGLQLFFEFLLGTGNRTPEMHNILGAEENTDGDFTLTEVVDLMKRLNERSIWRD